MALRKMAQSAWRSDAEHGACTSQGSLVYTFLSSSTRFPLCPPHDSCQHGRQHRALWHHEPSQRDTAREAPQGDACLRKARHPSCR